MASRRSVTAGSRRGLLLGLSGIAAIFVVQGAFNTFWTSEAENQARRLQEDSIASIELIARIGRDVDQQRILIDDHILAVDHAVMAQIEAQLREFAGDLETARRAYAALTELPNELPMWLLADAEITRFNERTEAALALSRRNLDDEARGAMASVAQEYTALDHHLAELIQINRKGASDSLARIKLLERSAARLVMGTRIVGLVILVLLGRWSLRKVSGYEAHQARLLALLEERNRELDAFASRIAHDLRSPLASLGLTTDLLSRTAAVEQASAIARLQRVIKRIDVMVGDLLALSRIASPPGDEACDPALVAAKVAEDFGERFGADATLRLDVAASGVACSAGLLGQVLWNLVENSVKYGRAAVRTEIKVSGRAAVDRYELSVSDNGMGMSPDDASRVFEAFYRAERAQDRAGTGLGLSIVKRIVEARRGTVTVQSWLDEGTTFILRFPLTKPPA